MKMMMKKRIFSISHGRKMMNYMRKKAAWGMVIALTAALIFKHSSVC